MAEVRVTHKDSIVDQVEQLHQQIAQRAYFLFLERAGAGADPWTDWLTAEQEIFRRPAIEVREQSGTYEVSASIAGLVRMEPGVVCVRRLISAHVGPTAGRVTLDETGAP
jgi:hypothetical protein